MKNQFLKAVLCPCNIGLLAKFFPTLLPLLGLGVGLVEWLEVVGHALMAVGLFLPLARIIHLKNHEGEKAIAGRKQAILEMGFAMLIIAAHMALLHGHDDHRHVHEISVSSSPVAPSGRVVLFL